MRKWLTVILVVFTFTSTYLYAKTDKAFVYKSRGRKDPFVPLVSKDGKLLVTYGVMGSINDVVLEGIIYDPKAESIVILNSMILKENDQVGRIKVKRIEEDRVILIFEDEEHIFKLKE